MISGTMKAARLHSIGQFQVDEIEIPIPHGNELLVKVGACGVCGSDIPRIYEHGTSNQHYPMVIGHEFSGTIVEVGETGDRNMIGKKGTFFPLLPCKTCNPCMNGHYAMCEHYDYLGSRRDGGFAEYCLVPDPWNFVESHNENTSLIQLAFSEPACVAQHAVRKGNVTAGMKVLIFGAGPIGLMAGRWANLFGAKVIFSDVVDAKVDFAREKGFDAVNSRKESLVDFIKSKWDNELADVVIEGTGFGAALNQAIECLKPFGHISLLGNPAGDTLIKQKIHSMILRKEITITGIWNSHFSNIPINEWKYTVEMMDRGLFSSLDLISHQCCVDDLPGIIDKVYHKTIDSWKVMCVF